MADYSRYANFVDRSLNANDISNFKRHPDYQYMLEHVGPDQGAQYLQCIQKNTTIPKELIYAFCEMNDAIGNPIRHTFGSLSCSPTCLRYIYHAHLILTHFKTFNEPTYDLIEVGGGYGGLCLAIHTLAPHYGVNINSYTIIDLSAPSRLQKKYLEAFSIKTPIHCRNAELFGADVPEGKYYLISNYCFSEISPEFQRKYIETLFPKVVHGFMAWNFISTYYFGFEYKEEPEEPNTGGVYNKYVRF
jgi:hypothetical protein